MLAWRGKNLERRIAVSEHEDNKTEDEDVQGHKLTADKDEQLAEPDVEGHKFREKQEGEPDVEGHQFGQVSPKHEA
jgi:hypothetical protein